MTRPSAIIGTTRAGFSTPFAPAENKVLKGLGVGLGASGGNVDGLGLPAYKTVGQNTFFSFESGVSEVGHRTQLAPQAYYYLGPWGVLTEYGLNEEGLQKGLLRRDVAFRAWQVAGSYILTYRRGQEHLESDTPASLRSATQGMGSG